MSSSGPPHNPHFGRTGNYVYYGDLQQTHEVLETLQAEDDASSADPEHRFKESGPDSKVIAKYLSKTRRIKRRWWHSTDREVAISRLETEMDKQWSTGVKEFVIERREMIAERVKVRLLALPLFRVVRLRLLSSLNPISLHFPFFPPLFLRRRIVTLFDVFSWQTGSRRKLVGSLWRGTPT